MLSIIPRDHREPARAALTNVFGLLPVADIAPVTGGASGALTYRIEVAERPYLLRIETARDVFRNPQRSYACMRTAAEAGIAPALHHADPAAGVVIMDFLPRRPLLEYPGGQTAFVRELAALIARLHAAPAFAPFGDYEIVLERMLRLIRDSGLFGPGALDAHAESFEQLRRAYPWGAATLVASHNDLNPGNIVFDGQRLWFIDWELAFRNDPLVDLSMVIENFALTPERAELLVHSYLGREPGGALRARVLLMRQFTRLFYACLMLSMSIGKRAMERELRALSVLELRAALAEGRLPAGHPDTLHSCGKTLLAGFLDAMSTREMVDAMRSARQA